MRLADLMTRPFSSMNESEQTQFIKEIRFRRTVIRPARKKHIKRAVKKKQTSRAKVESLMDTLTPEQIAEIRKEFG